MLSNQKSSRFFSFKGIALIAIALALLMNVTAFASGNSRFAFIDTAAEFFGLQSNIASVSQTTNATHLNLSNAFVDVPVTIPNVNAAPGLVSIPITIGDVSALSVISYDLNVDFDPAVIRPANPPVTQTGTLSSSMVVTPNFYNCQDPPTPTPMCVNGPNMGHLTLSAFQASPLGAGSTLIILNFVVQANPPGTTTTLAFADYTDPAPAFHPAMTLNEGEPVANPITNGSVTVPAGPTATFTATVPPTATSTNTFTPTNTSTPTNTPTPTGTATNTSTPTPTPLCAQVDIDDKTVSSGDPVTLSVMTSDLTSPPYTPAAFSADMHITFDPTVLSPAPGPFYGVTLGPVGLSNSSALTVNRIIVSPTAHRLQISVFGQTPFSGSGSLVDISWPTVTGAPGTFSPVFFTPFSLNGVSVPLGFWYNEDPLGSCVNDGSVSISGTAGGRIKYGNAIAAPANRWIPNTLLTGFGAPVVTDTTDNLGFYVMTGFGSGNYTIVPSRSSATAPDTHGSSISAFDAAETARYVVGLVSFTATQIFVAKVSGDPSVSSSDASKMARWAVSLPDTTFTGDWRFQNSFNFYTFVGTVTDDYLGYLMGDVSGNWCDPTSGVVPCNITGTNGGSRPAGNGPQRSAEVRAQNVSAPAGSDVVIPVSVNGAANKGAISYQFDLRYDPTVIQPQANAVTLGGTVSNDMSVVFNAIAPGLLKVAVYGTMPISESGVLLNFHFTAVGDAFSVSPITWENFMFNEGGIRTTLINSEVRLTPAVANTTVAN